MARTPVIAGNWKMYKTIAEAKEFLVELIPQVKECEARVYIAVPYTALAPLAEQAHGSNVVIGAQNMNDASEGAYTGEIAAAMLVEAGAKFVILGHSERRHVFGEDDAFVNRKVRRALDEGLQPIVCVGETLKERSRNQTEEILRSQIEGSLAGVTAKEMSKVILAYEPVWAIGTGKTATPKTAQESHQFIRQLVAELWNEEVAEEIVIQYGGSVKPDNVRKLMNQPDVDGALVGGASLSVESFREIVNFSMSEV
jgi:triosephosphate isomerase